MASSQVMSIRVSKKLQDQLGFLASATDRSKSWIVQKALEEYIEVQAWQAKELQQALKEEESGDFASDKEVALMFKQLKDENYLAKHRHK